MQVTEGEVPDHLAEDAALPQAPTILHELTCAYVAERYGGKQANRRQRAYLQTNVPRLIAWLTASARHAASQQRSRSEKEEPL